MNLALFVGHVDMKSDMMYTLNRILLTHDVITKYVYECRGRPIDAWSI